MRQVEGYLLMLGPGMQVGALVGRIPDRQPYERLGSQVLHLGYYVGLGHHQNPVGVIWSACTIVYGRCSTGASTALVQAERLKCSSRKRDTTIDPAVDQEPSNEAIIGTTFDAISETAGAPKALLVKLLLAANASMQDAVAVPSSYRT